jgi:hypothetical protein
VLLLALLAAVTGGCHARVPTATGGVLVYGATASGVAAAVAAARNGKDVVLLEPTRHVGGMTSGGLGATDVGVAATIGGIAREFYERVGSAYGQKISFAFEPRVAERVLRQMLAESGVTLVTDARVAEVIRSGTTLVSVVTDDGTAWSSDMFIDATYEGDLIALAGVSFTVGREPRAAYDERLAGASPAHPDPIRVDPYVVPGDPDSGLLPHVSADRAPAPGSGDSRVQPYNYRLCLTSLPANRIEIAAPRDYDPGEYEVLARYVEALVARRGTAALGELVRLSPLPNGKYDANNNPALLSTDLLGGSERWAESSEHARQRIRERHEAYTRGLLHFLATSPRLPERLRAEAGALGLCKDEFTSTGGWPPQLYVREARRMIGAYVVTEHDALRKARVADGIGLASYHIDCHPVQRLAVDGAVRTEGGLWYPTPRPFLIPYRALTPKPEQANNLLVSVAVSASHVAFGSIRMEPVFMIMGHAAGTAAALAIDRGTPVQGVDAEMLRARLRGEGQMVLP